MNRRPVIAVTGPKKGGAIAWVMTALALKRAGAVPVRVCDEKGLDMTVFDGMVLGGGSDITPEAYGEEKRVIERDTKDNILRFPVARLLGLLVKAGFPIYFSQPDIDLDRDKLECSMFHYALENRLPVLGICRGSQLINIALGGTLFQDIRRFYTVTPYLRTILPRKRIDIDLSSRLYGIINAGTTAVNALHIQAVKDLGTDLSVTAYDKNKVVQAIEHQDHPFMIGVQWHPEYLPYRSAHQCLFQALVDSAL